MAWGLGGGWQPHLSEDVQQPNGASRLPTKDRGDHGVDAATAHAAMGAHADTGQHGDKGHKDDTGHQEHAQQHTRVALQQKQRGQVRK